MVRIGCGAVLFDLDGVLVDSTAYIERQWTDWARAKGLDPATFLAICHGRRAVETIKLAAPWLDAEAEVARWRETAEDAVPLPPTPGARELIASLPLDAWAVVTSGARRFALARLAGAGLPEPTILVSADEVSQGKPSPEGYLRAAELLGMPPADCVVLEDAQPGIEAARAAGMCVVGVTTTRGPELLSDAPVTVSSLADVRLVPPSSRHRITLELTPVQVSHA